MALLIIDLMLEARATGAVKAIKVTAATIGNIVAKTGRTTGQARSAMEARQPIGRLITPEEVADAVWFCVASEGITGQAVNVDGGTVQP